MGSQFTIGVVNTEPNNNLFEMRDRVVALAKAGTESFGSVANTLGDPLAVDDTAVCHTKSSFTCPGTDAQYEQMVNAKACSETVSVKIDKMCDDGPCDSDPDSILCQ